MENQLQSLHEAERALTDEHGIPREMAQELFKEVDNSVEKIVDKCDMGEKVDIRSVQKIVKIGYVEHTLYTYELGVSSDIEEKIEKTLEDLKKHPISTTSIILGSKARESTDVMWLANEIQKENYSR